MLEGTTTCSRHPLCSTEPNRFEQPAASAIRIPTHQRSNGKHNHTPRLPIVLPRMQHDLSSQPPPQKESFRTDVTCSRRDKHTLGHLSYSTNTIRFEQSAASANRELAYWLTVYLSPRGIRDGLLRDTVLPLDGRESVDVTSRALSPGRGYGLVLTHAQERSLRGIQIHERSSPSSTTAGSSQSQVHARWSFRSLQIESSIHPSFYSSIWYHHHL